MLAERNGQKSLPGIVDWYGGKGLLAPKLIPLIPPSHIYCEPFGGAASLMMRLEPRPVEVYNDLDGRLVNLFRVLQNRRQFGELKHRLEHTPYARAEFVKALGILQQNGTASPVASAWAFFVAQNQGFGGIAKTTGDWGREIRTTSRGRAKIVSGWQSKLARLEDYARRMGRVQIEQRDAIEVLRHWDTPDTVYYVDPPYVHSTRVKGDTAVYQGGEPDDACHSRLLEALTGLQAAVVLSGYACPLYDGQLADWDRVDIQTACYAAGRTRTSKLQGKGNALKHATRTETIYINRRAADMLLATP